MLLALLFFISFLSASSAEESSAMFLKLKSGETLIFKLLDKPCVTFDETYTYVKSSSMSTALPYAYADISRIEFGETTLTAISTAEKENLLQFVYVNPDIVVLKGKQMQGVKVQVFSPDGKMAPANCSYTEEGASISLAGLPAGTYIIRANKQSFKIFRK